ncbi:hypothetical protein A3D88_02510 [Candidatus Peribacteria bacterium RIFCSPHIGHO2_02_FULL_52_16]|nr:MAG: hypothetical protein A2706_00335 [Candidatus Peribacteria bacterium RIFCSPHIGHO2_01_FULL_51_35]OGJ61634.1 MAG: hypothetical protein A3D88_02510 [Candidatus Peribacteria bacterium RIFCSPHIGHO2_02_FULL_52_16]
MQVKHAKNLIEFYMMKKIVRCFASGKIIFFYFQSLFFVAIRWIYTGVQLKRAFMHIKERNSVVIVQLRSC